MNKSGRHGTHRSRDRQDIRADPEARIGYDKSLGEPLRSRYDVGMGRFSRWLVAPLCFGLGGAAVCGKERHLEKVRALLIAKAARCTSCHADAAGAALNAYGQRLAERTPSKPLADRIATLESDRGPDPSGTSDAAEDDAEDVDNDGVANWIEILASANPADPTDTPDAATARRIEAVVSCKICHRQVNLPGGGLKSNPHNVHGALLARTLLRVRGRRAPRGKDAIREAAEAISIVTRLALIRTKKPRGSRATYWEKLRLLHAPADASDKPDPKALAAFRKVVMRQKRKSTRDATLGLDTEAHPLDGFLAPGKDLP